MIWQYGYRGAVDAYNSDRVTSFAPWVYIQTPRRYLHVKSSVVALQQQHCLELARPNFNSNALRI